MYGRMTQKELNLFEFASCAMAEAGANATEIMGCEVLNDQTKNRMPAEVQTSSQRSIQNFAGKSGAMIRFSLKKSSPHKKLSQPG
jgi:hypothetical protein